MIASGSGLPANGALNISLNEAGNIIVNDSGQLSMVDASLAWIRAALRQVLFLYILVVYHSYNLVIRFLIKYFLKMLLSGIN